MMQFCMSLYTVWTQRLQAIDAHAEIGELFTRVFETLEARTVAALHLSITDTTYDQNQSKNE